MGTYNPVKRDSDGTTIRLDKQEAEQAEIDARAKRVIQVDSSGDNISSTNPLPVTISDGTEQVDVISTNGLNGLVTIAPGHVSLDNSTEDPDLLLADEVFTGEWEDIVNFGVVVISVISDVSSATDGLMVQFSTQGSEDTLVNDDVFTIEAGSNKTFSFQAAAKFFRIIYTNGGNDQGHFHLQTILKPYYVKPSSHRISDSISGQDDAELMKSVITYQSTGTDTFKNIGVQVPLPTDGDSIYEKDINLVKSDNGGFSGEIIDYFNSLNSVNNDASATNPKVIKVWLKRTAYGSALGLGCDDLSKNFSNIKLELFGSGEVIRNTIDESSDDTKRNSFLFEFAPTAFNGFFLSFFTADEVGLSNITMPKEIQVASRLKALKPDGTVTDIDATAGGNLKISLEELENAISVNSNSQLRVTTFNSSGNELTGDIMLDVASGTLTGKSSEHKFGRNIDLGIGTEDVWDAGGTYAFYPTASIDVDIVSTSGSDTMDIQVFGLDGTGALQNETVTLTGTTPVNLANQYWRIFRLVNVNTSSNVGIITVEADGGGDGVADNTVAAQISIGFNQTLMSLYTVPVGKTVYIVHWGASFDQGGAGVNPTLVDMEFRVRLNLSISDQKVFQIKNHHGLISTGTSYFQHSFAPYFKIDALSDIKILATTNTNATDVHADFDLIIVDN